MQREKTLQVNILHGVEDGIASAWPARARLACAKNAPGDLYIFSLVAPHRFFQRSGADILSQVPIRMTTAALGGDVEVPGIDGKRARVSVPAGTQSGHRFRLRGKGMSALRSNQRGDHYIEVQVETPVNLSKRQKQLLQDFEASDEAARPASNPPASSTGSRNLG